jgi:2'-5' RNA ligase
MPYAFELALDPASAAVVRRAWQELADAGIGYVATSGARPHVTLGIWDSLDLERAEAELARFAAETSSVQLTFASVGLFPGWVPHCTLATDLEPDRFGDALEIAARAPLPLESRLVEVGIVEFRPVKQLVSYALGGR